MIVLRPVESHCRADCHEGSAEDDADYRPDNVCTSPIFLRGLGVRPKCPNKYQDDVHNGNAYEEKREHPLACRGGSPFDAHLPCRVLLVLRLLILLLLLVLRLPILLLLVLLLLILLLLGLGLGVTSWLLLHMLRWLIVFVCHGFTFPQTYQFKQYTRTEVLICLAYCKRVKERERPMGDLNHSQSMGAHERFADQRYQQAVG